MLSKSSDADLVYPFAEPPGSGEIKEVAPGILWVRIPLPFRLNHINVYLIEDGDVRFPTQIVAAKFMQKEDRIAGAGILIIQLHAVVSCHCRHHFTREVDLSLAVLVLWLSCSQADFSLSSDAVV